MALPIVGAFVAALGATIIPMAIRLLAGIGVAVITYEFVGPMWDDMVEQITTNLGLADASIKVILVMARVDDAIAVVLSFGFSLLVMKGLNAITGTVSRARWRSTVVGE